MKNPLPLIKANLAAGHEARVWIEPRYARRLRQTCQPRSFPEMGRIFADAGQGFRAQRQNRTGRSCLHNCAPAYSTNQAPTPIHKALAAIKSEVLELSIPRLDPLTLPLIRRCFALSYFCTACGFAPRLKRKPSVCWVVLAALRAARNLIAREMPRLECLELPNRR